MQGPLHAVKGLGGCVIRGPLPVIPAEPRQWPPVVAVLPSQLVARFHSRFLRAVSETSGSSQRLLGACVQAILLSRNRGLANETLSRYVPLLNAPEHLRAAFAPIPTVQQHVQVHLHIAQVVEKRRYLLIPC